MNAAATPFVLHRSTKPDPKPTPELDSLSDKQRERWFGIAETTDEMRAAWKWLSSTVARTWPGKTLTVHPGITGLRLMQYDLPVRKEDGKWYEYPQLPPEAIDIIRQHSPQHRQEAVHLTTERIVYYDMRDAYSSLLSFGIPAFTDTKEYRHDNDSDFIPTVDGFYFCDITVPSEWGHIGLIPAHSGVGKNKWMYPRQPGQIFRTWIDDHDIRVLQKWGWKFAIRERIILNGNRNTARPLVGFSQKFVPLLQLAEDKRREADSPTRKYIRDALRNMVNMAIGCMHNHSHWEEVPVEILDEDESAEAFRTASGDMAARRRVEHSTFRDRWFKPEWSSAIYRREIRAVTKQALMVPFDDVLLINGDALYLRNDPGFHDSGLVGNFRKKGEKTFPSPRTIANSSDLRAFTRE